MTLEDIEKGLSALQPTPPVVQAATKKIRQLIAIREAVKLGNSVEVENRLIHILGLEHEVFPKKIKSKSRKESLTNDQSC